MCSPQSKITPPYTSYSTCTFSSRDLSLFRLIFQPWDNDAESRFRGRKVSHCWLVAKLQEVFIGYRVLTPTCPIRTHPSKLRRRPHIFRSSIIAYLVRLFTSRALQSHHHHRSIHMYSPPTDSDADIPHFLNAVSRANLHNALCGRSTFGIKRPLNAAESRI